jgi:lipopolysaccharide biosynthesis protein
MELDMHPTPESTAKDRADKAADQIAWNTIRALLPQVHLYVEAAECMAELRDTDGCFHQLGQIVKLNETLIQSIVGMRQRARERENGKSCK